MATLASFKLPKIANEPNVRQFRTLGFGGRILVADVVVLLQKHYAKGSPEREHLAAAVAAFKKNAPLEIPLVVGGKSVSTVA